MANLVVTTLEDETEDNSSLSLREAIALADAADGEDTITFAEGLEGTIRLTNGSLVARGTLIIDGDGRITVSGDALGNDVTDAEGITDIQASQAAQGDLLSDNVAILLGDGTDITLEGLTLTGGASTGIGGAVYTSGTLSIRDSEVAGNYAAGFGAGIAANQVIAETSTFRGNVSGGEGAGVAGVNVSITDSRLIGNSGGAVGAFGDLIITDSVLEANESAYATAAAGGMITITGSLFKDNIATDGAGGFTADNAEVANSTFVGNEGAYGVTVVEDGDTLDLSHVTITDNTSTEGAAVSVFNTAGDILIENSVLVGNDAPPNVGGDVSAFETVQSVTPDGEAVEVLEPREIINQVDFIGFNIVGADDAAFDASSFGNVANGDPALIFEEEVADNGGPTPTLALKSDFTNPAIDASAFSRQTEDARGEARFVDALFISNGGGFDLGAVELQLDELPDPFEVTTLDDVVDASDGFVSLREAIAFANGDQGENEITFAEGLNGTLRLTQGTLNSTDALVIDGDGRVTITGDVLGNDVTDANGVTDARASQSAEGDLLSDNVQIFLSGADGLTLEGLTLTGGSASRGGVVFSTGSITIRDSEVVGNTASDHGGGVYGYGVTIEDSRFAGNVSAETGGAVESSSDITISGSELTDNIAGGGGAALYTQNNATIIDSEISGNIGDSAIYAGNDLLLLRTSVLSNTGDAIFHNTGNATIFDSAFIGNEGFYGAVFSSGTLSIFSSLFDDNTGTGSGVVVNDGDGLRIVNSTFVDNKSGAREGIISALDELSLEHVTVTRNAMEGGGAAVEVRGNATSSNILNSIIIDNQNDGTAPSEVAAKDGALVEDIEFLGSNIVGTDSDAFDASGEENVINADPSLIFESEVADNGGPTPTLALLSNPENPAIDADSVTSQTFDVRGEDRTVDIPGIANGGDVDLGAFELQQDEAPNPFEVTTLDDVVDATDGLVSLREAILAANATPGEDVITFADDLTGTIQLTEGTLSSLDALVIDGDGRITITGDALGNDVTDSAGITDIDASAAAEGDLLSDNVRILNQFGGDLTLEGLTLTGGSAYSSGGAVNADDNRFNLEIIDSTIAGNSSGYDGGGAYALGQLTVTNSVISGNVASGAGGGLMSYSGVTLIDSRVIDNTSFSGGGIFADDSFGDGAVRITNSEVSNNTAGGEGGGVFASGNVTATNSAISDNSAEGDGGGVKSSRGDLSLTGSELSGNTAGAVGGGAQVDGLVTVIDSLVRDNAAQSRGGGLDAGSARIENSEFSGNTGVEGGGFRALNNVEVTDSVFVANEAAGSGAFAASGTITVTGSLFKDNVGGEAGAIGSLGTSASATVSNSTFVGNQSANGAGAIASKSRLDLTHVTVTGNTSNGDAGAVNLTSQNATGTITNSIITSNTGGGSAGPDLTDQSGPVPYSGSFYLYGVNIIGEDEAAFDAAYIQGNAINAAAADLFVTEGVADNGGPVPTLALKADADNVALDASNSIVVTGDARGGPRPRDLEDVDNGGTVDLGAFELNLANLAGDGIVDNGEFGAEEILGTDGNDTLRGGPAFDDSLPGSGEDTIKGFGGDDFIEGEGGSDLIFGGDGDDTINGGGDFGDRADTIFGGDGNDVIDGGAGLDAIFAEAGDDTIRISGNDTIDNVDGGDGVDTLDLSATDPDLRHNVNLQGNSFNNFFQVQVQDSLDTISTLTFGSVTDIENVIGGDGDDTFTGDDQANRLEGRGGNDVLRGLGGDDVLIGGDGADLLEGGDGNDILFGGEASEGDGVDTLSGGAGDDTFDGGFFEDLIYGGAGNDTVLINENDFADIIDGGDDIDTVDFSEVQEDIAITANLATGELGRQQQGRVPNDAGSLTNVENLIGGGQSDRLTGDDQGNLLDGRGGDDTLAGGAGNDTLIGGAGVNSLDGGTGEDIAIFDGALADFDLDKTGDSFVLTGSAEQTTVQNVERFQFDDVTLTEAELQELIDTTPNSQDNTVAGTTGNDTIDAGAGDDDVNGDDGDDVISGDDGNDTLDGGDGNDTLNGGAGNDTIFGGEGDDTANGDGGDDVVFGGIGNDTLNGGEGNDTLDGGTGNDTLNGGTGRNSITGGDGDDTVVLAGDVDDFVITEDEDGIRLTRGDDVTVVREVETFTFEGDDGDRTLSLAEVQELAEAIDDGNAPGQENDPGQGNQPTNGDDTLIGTAGADTISALAGDDVVKGRAGDDRLFGNSGSDALTGNKGADQIRGGNGKDNLKGSKGNDQLFGGKGADKLKGGSGSDKLKGGSGQDDLFGGSGRDKLFGGNGADRLYGGAGKDQLQGGKKNDALFGGSAGDVLKGGAGADVLRGGKGKDELKGGTGRDQLFGGAGADALTGGGGADVFVFGRNSGNDVVTDFGGADTLRINGGFDFDDLTITQSGNDVRISFAKSTILLEDTAKAQINSTDFDFG